MTSDRLKAILIDQTIDTIVDNYGVSGSTVRVYANNAMEKLLSSFNVRIDESNVALYAEHLLPTVETWLVRDGFITEEQANANAEASES